MEQGKAWDFYDKGFDPFQIFEVCETKCVRVRVHVLNGVNITKGKIGDFLDTPDPYLLVCVPNTPNGQKRTRTVDNCRNPTWDNIFYFFVNPQLHCELRVTLMDANAVTKDCEMGTLTIDMDCYKVNVEADVTLMFKEGAKIFLKILKEENSRPDLRFGLPLCKEEKEYLEKRRKHVFEGMRRFLGDKDGPQTEDEVPTVAVLGSGGGIRALVGFSGAVNALQEMQLDACLMFIAALSGSSWFLSYLYSQPDFPDKGAMEFQAELRQVLSEHMIKCFNPVNIYKNVSAIVKKYVGGQPVSLTDLFGHQLGDLLLRKHKDVRLSQQRRVLENGQTPLPLYTCINVKKDVSARVFQEWVEFSPYEIGVAKYGTFAKPELFGCKFYLGNIIRKFEEPPLHFLQGIWGSAYSIQFKRLVREICQMPNTVEQALEEEEDDDDELRNYLPKEDMDKEEDDDLTSESDVESHDSDKSDSEDVDYISLAWNSLDLNSEQNSLIQATLDFLTTEIHYEERDRRAQGYARLKADTTQQRRCSPWKEKKKVKRDSKHQTQKTLLESTVDSLLTNSVANSRVLRAGVIFNVMRGLHLHNILPVPDVPPTEPYDESDFKGLFEKSELQKKKLYLVDSGLTFNLPFPILLRFQRAVDVFLCFDFSVRDTDEASPFGEILLAEKWARLMTVPFPPIRDVVRKLPKNEPLKECYVFEDENDPHVPVVLYFPLVNNKFREFKAPGVKRETQEEKDFGSFDIFSDPKKPYHTFKFRYSEQSFDRLSKLVGFNLHDSKPVIREYLKKAVDYRRKMRPKPPMSMQHFDKISSRCSDKEALEKLRRYMKTFQEA